MDRLKSMGDQFGSDQIKEQLQGVQFPASKDQIISQLQQKGVPSQVLDRIRNIDTSQFDSADEVVNKVKSFM